MCIYYINKAFNTQYNEAHYYNKHQYITTNVNTHKIKKGFTYNNEHVLNVRNEYPPKIYKSTNYRTHIDYVGNNSYKKYDNITFNTNHMYKTIGQNTTEVVNTYRNNKHLKLKKTYYNISGNVVVHKNDTIHTNGNRNVTKHNKPFNATDNNYYT